jgi:hypothetical protein
MELIASVKPDAFLRQKRNESKKTGMQEKSEENLESRKPGNVIRNCFGFVATDCLSLSLSYPSVFMIKFISL